MGPSFFAYSVEWDFYLFFEAWDFDIIVWDQVVVQVIKDLWSDDVHTHYQILFLRIYAPPR